MPCIGETSDFESELASAKEAIELFCSSLKTERNASDHTIRAYRCDLEAYIGWAARQKIAPLSVTHKQLRAYLADQDKAQYSRTTINRRMSSLRSFFRWLNVVGIIDRDPAGILQSPKKQKSLPHVIRPKDMAKLLSLYSAADGQDQSPEDMRNQAILEFLYACGARVSEASSLLTENVDFEQGVVRVFGKGSKERIIPLHDMAISSMKRYVFIGRQRLLKGKDSPYFFVSTRGNQMSTDAIRKLFKLSLRRAGLDETLSPHAMRHTFATDLLDGGANLRSVQEMLGHASLSTTQIYTHLSTTKLKEVHSQAHPRA